jgi:hypothetical protein
MEPPTKLNMDVSIHVSPIARATPVGYVWMIQIMCSRDLYSQGCNRLIWTWFYNIGTKI